VRLAVILVFAVVILAVLMPLLRRRPLASAPPPPPSLPDELVKDPVCQTYVVRSRAVRRSAADGPRYFCSAECARRDAGG
jgi:hypothetical protein